MAEYLMKVFYPRLFFLLSHNQEENIDYTLFYMSTLYKNTEARFAKRIGTHLEHAQSQVRKILKKVWLLKFNNVIS